MRSIKTRVLSILLAAVLLAALALPAMAEGTVPGKLPYNTDVRLTATDEVDKFSYLFTPPASGAYSFRVGIEAYVHIYQWDGSRSGQTVDSGENGVHGWNRNYGDDLRWFYLEGGRTYYVDVDAWNTGAFTLRVISFADQLKEAEAQGAPVLTLGKTVDVHYDGVSDATPVRFTPPESGRYVIQLNGSCRAELCGEDGPHGGDSADYSMNLKSELIGGETYILYVWQSEHAETDVKVTAKADTDTKGTFAPVTVNAADLDAGPLHYTVLILDDDHLEEGSANDLKERAIQFCRTLAEGPGESYVAVVGLYNDTAIYCDHTTDVGFAGWGDNSKMYQLTDEIFTKDLSLLSKWIGWITGDGDKCDLYTGLALADGLLDAARAAYGDAVDTNIVVISDADVATGASLGSGPYNTEKDVIHEWGDYSRFNACLMKAGYVRSKHPIYSVSMSGGRGYRLFGDFSLISEAAGAACDRFMADLASGLSYAYTYIIDYPEAMGTALADIAAQILSGHPLAFADVSPRAWYFNDVKTAYETGLINGRSETVFAPEENLTYAEAVKLAACMHQVYITGEVTLAPGGNNWYDAYVQYARDNGIITKDYDWNAEVTRAGYVEIFAGALPAEAFTVKNRIADGAIPDVSMRHPQAAAIYRLYRAGIIVGSDQQGTFHPDAKIDRAAVAAIMTRMLYPEARRELTLG